MSEQRAGSARAQVRVRVGDAVGPYQLVREIGRGAMATVYEASRPDGKPVAVKVLLPEAEHQEAIRERFEREGRILQALRHENIARVHEVGTLPSGAAYLVIDLLDGEDLGTVLTTKGPLSIGQAVEYVYRAALGVAEAHAQGIVHRDLKPANIFLAKNRRGKEIVKVLDFGVAKVLGIVESEERDREVIGSPHYIAPEQLRGSAEVTPRTDVWALGVVLYKALTDSFPFEGETIAELCRKIRDAVPYPIRDSRPDCPLGLQDVVRRCLAKDPAARYADANELADALQRYVPDDRDDATVLEESTRLMPAARGLQQASALESISRLRPGADPSILITPSFYPSSPSSIPPAPSPSVRSRSSIPHAANSALSGPRGRMWWAIALFAAVILAGTGISLMIAAAEARRDAPSTVRVRVTSDPPGALFTLDFGAKKTTPNEITLARDERTHVLTVWKDGYRPETRDVAAASDTIVEIKLAPVR